MKAGKPEGFTGQRVIVLPAQVISQLINDPVINKLYLTDIGFYPEAIQHYMERKSGIPQHILIYCISGKGWIETGQHYHQLQANQFIILPRDTPHRYGSDQRDPWSIYWIHFSGLSSDYFSAAMDSPEEISASEYSRLKERNELFDEMYLNLEMGHAKENLYYVNMVLWHYLGSFRFVSQFRQVRKIHDKDILTGIIQYMNENLEKDLALKHFAGRCNYSPSHFTSIFKHRTGYPPIEYFIRLKMQKACQYLDMTEFRIKEIADFLGYSDPYYFSRLFMKHIKLSPRNYRQQKKG